MTSRAISHYALPVAGLNVAFFSATHVYWPQYPGGVIYNYDIPRDLVGKIIKRPIYVQGVYKVDNSKSGKFEKGGPNKGIKIYAPGLVKDDKPNRGPKKFADNPNDFKPKANTFNDDVPKGWGPTAKGATPTGKEAGSEPSRIMAQFGGPNNEQANRKDGDRGPATSARSTLKSWAARTRTRLHSLTRQRRWPRSQPRLVLHPGKRGRD
jgi:hypothetical protein